MSTQTDSLRELYLDIAGEETITEPQEEERSHAPIEAEEADFERELSDFLRRDGLTDAVEGAEHADSST